MQKLRIAVIQTRWPGEREPYSKFTAKKWPKRPKKARNWFACKSSASRPYFASTLDPSGFDWAEPLEGGPTHEFLGQLASQYGIFIIGSIFEREGEKFWDTATLYNPQGGLHGFTRKVHIPQGEGYHEDHFFAGSDQCPDSRCPGRQSRHPDLL
jgi:N-carbamoylputrescine amidase